MGFMGLLFKVAVECFDILAWPLFALGYPLCASIQAFETNSTSDTQRLITYWICFSLILLFEHAFEKLLEWLPYWPYIKLMMIGCLIVPHFDGSFYVYKHFVHPCLSMNPRIVFDWLIKLLELLKQVNFLIEEKIQAKDINAVEIREKNEVSATEQVRQMQPNFSLPGNTCDLVEIREMTAANSMVVSGDPPGILPLKKTQKEWSCAVCQVTTKSEADLSSHLQGKQHEDACEKLKAKSQSSKNKLSSVETGRPHDKEIAKDHPDKEHSENVSDKQKAKIPKSDYEAPASVESHAALENKETGSTSLAGGDISCKQHMNAQKQWICNLCQEICSTEIDFTSHLLRKRHTDACEKLKAKDQPLESNVSPTSSWTCAVCKITTTTKIDLVSHFQGQGHAVALEKLEANPNSEDSFEPWICGICDVKIESENSLLSHLQGRRHCHTCKEYKMGRETAKDESSSASFGNISKMQEWSCAVCQVTARSEADLSSHLQGKQHEDACEKLKAKSQSSKNKLSSVETGRPQKNEIAKDHPDKEHSENASDKQKAESLKSDYEAPASVESHASLENEETGFTSLAGGDISCKQHMNAQKQWICNLCREICSTEIDFTSHLLRKRHTDACEKMKAKDQPLESNDSPTSSWTCAVCKITTPTKIDLVSHFQGEGHAVALEKLKANPNSKDSFVPWICGICDVKIESENSLLSHLQGRRHCRTCKEYKMGRETAKDESSSALFGNISKMQEWSCAVCQVTARSEADLSSHLQGKQHEDACEMLKAKSQSSKNKLSSVETGRPQKNEIAKDHPDKEHSENASDKQKAESLKSDYEAPASVESHAALENEETGFTSLAGGDISCKQHMNAQKQWICNLCPEICSTEIDFTSHLLRKRHTDACEKMKAKDQPLESNDSPTSSWTCAVCKITTTTKIDLVSHFQGEGHAVALEKLKANPNSKDSFVPWICGICDVKIESENSLLSHLQGRRHCRTCKEYKMGRETAKDESSSASFGNISKMQEWSCAVCQITTRSEADLSSHLQGKQHEDACEKLKAKSQSSKNKLSSVETGRPQKKEIAKDHPDKEHSENVSDKQKAESLKSDYEAPASVESHAALENEETGFTSLAGGDISCKQHMNAQKQWICNLCQEICSTEIDFTSHLLRKRHTDACEKLKAKDQPLESNVSPPSSWTCAVCKITTTTKIDLVSHFQGQGHAVALEKLEANPNSKDSFGPWICGICDVKIESENSLLSHLQGRRHCRTCKEYKMGRETAKDESSSASFGNISKEKSGVVEVRGKGWWCTICDVSCSCEANMKDHLNGSKHLARTGRNDAVFNNKHEPVVALVRETIDDAGLIDKTFSNLNVSSGACKVDTWISWSCPPYSILKLNTDASYDPLMGIAAGGGLVRDFRGRWKLGFVSKFGCCPIQVAGAWAILNGLESVLNAGITSIVVECDNQALVHMIQGLYFADIQSLPIITQIRSLAHSFSSFSIHHVHREANFAAGCLSHMAFDYPIGTHALLDPPQRILHWLQHDLVSTSYVR